MIRILFSLILALHIGAGALRAQDDLVWVQIEAQPTLAEAQQAIQGYAARLQDVNGFALGGGWYAIALGPYTRGDATQVLRVLRREGAIPRDSYIAFSSSFRQQFWPVGANLLDLPQPAAPVSDPAAEPQAQAPEPQAEREAAPEPVIAPADESPAEARRSEGLLSREERMDLQRMLKWAGFYDAGIDGAFGRGTRSSMAEWQRANNFEPTGVLTTLQRQELSRQYNAVLEGLGLQMVQDSRTGIEMKLPMGLVALDGYESPFAHYRATDGGAAQVLLISQVGDRNTLYGLYDILQTLAIVPEDGPRDRNSDSFVLNGSNDRIVTYIQAALGDGQIKGFGLVWPAGDEERRLRLLNEMRDSFARLPGVLEASAGMTEEQRIDLVSGLEVRKPLVSRSGFYVDDRGTVVTTREVLQNCGRITLDETHEASVVAEDADAGIAILRPSEALAPVARASFADAVPRLQSDVAVAGYSYGGVLGAPTLTYGQLADLRGLNGETTVKRLALAAMPGDAGGPVFDSGGAVLGMLLPEGESAQKLPEDVSFAADGAAIRAILNRAGVTAAAVGQTEGMAPEDLTNLAAGMTVLVSCWE